ncbi:MAG: chalcone isomerase family protein [Burkholderiaceae bacterium]|nr:chalcone isomerase family protein [Burkholderiaceae bacterium]
MRRRALIPALMAGLSLPALAHAVPPPELASELPGARWRGAATLRWMGLRIYDARLWSPETVAADAEAPEQPLALELQYARSLVGRLIAERSLDEMRRLAPIPEARAQRWLESMAQLFPDVQAGDRLTGVLRPGQSARFWHNGRLRGELADAEFARLFFGIWLSPRTSEPALRRQLIGGGS